MSLKGFQDFWIPGTRVLIQKESTGNPNPLIDIGLIQSVTPTVTPTVLQLQDSDGGVKQLVDEALTEILESYDVQTANMNLDNLSLMFLSDDPEVTVQVFQDALITHYVHPERLVKIVDGSGTPMFNLWSINGVMSETGTYASYEIDSFDATAQTIDLDPAAGDVTADFTFGDLLILTSGTNAIQDPLNPGTYSVQSSAFIGASFTRITLFQGYRKLNSSEVAAGSPQPRVLTPGASGTAVFYIQDNDWEAGRSPAVAGGFGGASGPISRGYFRITQPVTTGGTGQIQAPGNVRVSYTLGSGGSPSHIPYIRQIRPQSLSKVVRAKVWLYISLENDARAYVREFDATITPSGMTLGDATDFANMTLTFKVLNDLSSDYPGGRIYYFEGDTHDLSGLR